MKKQTLHSLFFVLLWVGLTQAAPAPQPLRLAGIFGSHMVLQRDTRVPVWGFATPGQKVTVEIGGQSVKAKTGKDGRWSATLEPLRAGGAPLEMKVVAGKEAVQISDILVGDVWICSGQSNMQCDVAFFPWADAEAAQAKYPSLRLFTVERAIDLRPQADIRSGRWKAAMGDSIRDFSATGYFFGRELSQSLNVPIGLISTSWGGTIVESWTSREGFLKFPAYADYFKAAEAGAKSLEAIRKAEQTNFAAWISGPFMQGEGMKGEWYKPGTDLAGWVPVPVPGLWDKAGLKDYKGTVWYKTRFRVSDLNKGKNLYLHLGALSKWDIVWVNGRKVGQTLDQWMERRYRVPAEALVEGENELTVRVTNRVGTGGFTAGKGLLMLSADTVPAGDVYILNGTWKCRADDGLNAATLPIKPDTSFGPNAAPALLYNAMIAPLIPVAFKGAIWYQGESNADRAFEYRTLFPNLISDWRARWGQGDFPFLFVQLANFNNNLPLRTEPGPSTWAELRDAQNRALSLPAVGMAVAIDIGEALDIHPRNKQEVGRRLSLAARKIAYNENIVSSGPLYKSMEVRGAKAVVRFDNSGSGLAVRNNSAPAGFTLAGADKRFFGARAEIAGETVVVTCDSVPAPASVRYAWADNPESANLINREGLPASPFRTDTWPGLTDTMTFIKVLAKPVK